MFDPSTPIADTVSSLKSKSTRSSQQCPPSSSSGPKQTENNDNVRASLANQGMYFEDEESYHYHSELQKEIESLIFRERGSAAQIESLRRIRSWRAENATKDEGTYFAGLVPQIIKGSRSTSSTNKRTFQGEIIVQAKSFDSDGLDVRQNANFVRNILPRRIQATEKRLGLTNPKPDYVYGLRRSRHPDPQEPLMSSEVEALIGVAPGLLHPFFVIENKGCEDSIETAENQAIRSGAALVAARRELNKKARHDGEEEEEVGPDMHSYAFSCTWVPQMANIHVHWYELRANHKANGKGATGVYHMNLVRGYLMSDGQHVSDFRRDIHGILDWGVSPKRKETLKRLVSEIVTNEETSVSSKAS